MLRIAVRIGTHIPFLALAACILGPRVTETPTLRRFSTASPSPTVRIRTATVDPIPTVGPTSTPLTHLVEEDDTLLAIAAQYGLTLDDLLAANPGLNPLLLTIGQAVIIPGPGGEPIEELAVRATPAPLTLSTPRCFSGPTESLVCLLTAHNPGGEPLEGIVVTITLVDAQGKSLTSSAAPAPLGVLASGSTLPIAVRFASGIPFGFVGVSAVVASAYRAPESEARLLAFELRESRHAPSPDRKTWELAGEVELAQAPEGTRARVTIVASGMDSDGRLAAYATWRVEAMAAGESASFRILLFSLSPALEFVDVVAQAEILP